jgi:hypothetical protein
MKKNDRVVKSDLLHQEVVEQFDKKLEEVKTYLIYATTGEIEKNDSGALEHLKNLNYLQMHLSDLADNLKQELIIFDHEKAWGKFD